jgi:hypothetical protein
MCAPHPCVVKYEGRSSYLRPSTTGPVKEVTMGNRKSTPYIRGGLSIPVICVSCGASFLRSNGPQKRCDTCRTATCATCGKEFTIPEGRKSARFCSRSCQGRYPETVARLAANRGVKPRTYHLRHRDKHGCAADRDWRRSVFERDDYTCQQCGKRGGRLHAHHIKAYKDHPELRHVLSNGQTLCVECHKQTDTFGWSKYWHGRTDR